MRIYSVPSRNLAYVKFLDLKMVKISPRQLMYMVMGVLMLYDASQGNAVALFVPLGIAVIALAFVPFRFLPPEYQMYHFLLFRLKKHDGQKSRKTVVPEMAGAGKTIAEEEADDEAKPQQEKLHIDDLERPYTLSLKTSEKRQFIPVTVLIDGRKIANTVTDRRGNVSCTIMIDDYSTKRIRVVRSDLRNSDSGGDNVLYDRSVVFAKG